MYKYYIYAILKNDEYQNDIASNDRKNKCFYITH